MRVSPRPQMFANDGLHPTEVGQRRLGKIIADALTPRLAGAALPVASRPPRISHHHEQGIAP
jgi:hypothetical protein